MMGRLGTVSVFPTGAARRFPAALTHIFMKRTHWQRRGQRRTRFRHRN